MDSDLLDIAQELLSDAGAVVVGGHARVQLRAEEKAAGCRPVASPEAESRVVGVVGRRVLCSLQLLRSVLDVWREAHGRSKTHHSCLLRPEFKHVF